MNAQKQYGASSLRILADAEYGIKRLREEPEQYGFYLRGTLASLHGVGYYLLEEYNQKFGLGIRFGEKLDIGSFKKRAAEKKNLEALKFIGSYEKGWKKLLKDPVVKLIIGPFGERHVVIHREQATMQVHHTLLTPDQHLVEVGKQTRHFLDRQHEQVPELEVPDHCEYCLAKLKGFRISLIARF